MLTGARPGRTSADEVTVFDSVGFAVEDFTVLRYAASSTAGTDLVRPIDLIASPPDPKDLFSLVRDAAAVPAVPEPVGE